MSSITIRNLPEGVKESLANRARATGESLESLAREILTKEAGGTTDETWSDLVFRLAKEAAALPSSDPAEFDFDHALRGRSLARSPLDFDWWPDQLGMNEDSA